jgi:ribosomal protein S8E
MALLCCALTDFIALYLQVAMLTCRQRYNATNNELLRTQTLVKSAIVDVDATPFRQWYEAHVSSAATTSIPQILTST